MGEDVLRVVAVRLSGVQVSTHVVLWYLCQGPLFCGHLGTSSDIRMKLFLNINKQMSIFNYSVIMGMVLLADFLTKQGVLKEHL